MVLDYIQDNFIMLFELAGLWIMLRISAHTSVRVKRLTIAVIILLFLESICFRVEAWTQEFQTLSLARPMLTAATYTVYPVILFLAMQITVDKHMPRRELIFSLILIILNGIVCFTSQWTHLVCWFDETNHYQGGQVSYLPYGVFFVYSMLFLIKNYLYFQRYSVMNRFITYFIVIAPFVGVIMTIMMKADDEYCALFTSALLLYYLCIYIHMAKIDPLTALLNRQSYYQDIQHYHEKISGVASVDMNELKYYNDTLGHAAGDKALKTIAGIMQANCGPNATVYRVGGDEFMIFYVSAGDEKIRASLAKIQEKLSETPYVCAFGYDVRTLDNTLEDMIRVSDQRMYENKAALKRAVLEQGGTLHGRD